MPPKTRAPSIIDIKNQLLEGLRRTSRSPSIEGYRPQNHQIPFHESTSMGRLFLGGNRAGKTVAGGAEMVWWLTGRHPYQETPRPPIKARGIASDFEDGVNRVMKPEIARWIPPSELKNGSWEDSYQAGSRTLTLINGSTLEFMSYDQDIQKFAGTSRHCIWFDEEPPEDVFNENMLRLVDVGGHWWLTMTPLIDMSWTYDRLYEPALAGGMLTLPDGSQLQTLDLFQAGTAENEYINLNILASLTDGLSDVERDARTKGTYFSYTGSIYGDVIDQHTFIPSIIDSDEWPIYYNKWEHFAMLDHGFTNPTAFYLGCYDHEGKIIIYWEHYASNMLVKEHADIIKAKLKELRLTNKIEYMVADPAMWQKNAITGTSIAAEYGEHGLFFGQANNDVIGGINRVMSRLKHKLLFITQNCEKAIWEFKRYRWARFENSKTASRNNAKETPMKKDDHAMDAIRYGVVSRPKMEYEQEIRPGNILNAPVARLMEEDWVDSGDFENNGFNFDDFLGDDF